MLFITSDLHLPGGNPAKEMGARFPLWHDHVARLARNWRRVVGADDTVIVAGDISWALKPAAAAGDMQFIDGLPGRKLLLRGNHDYWIAKTEAKQEQFLAAWPSLALLSRSRPALAGAFALAGTRLWELPSSQWWQEELHRKTYEKEKRRLAEALCTLRAAAPGAIPVLVLHHPPLDLNQAEPGELEQMIIASGIKRCYYGHLHPAGPAEPLIAFPYERFGVVYQLVAVDSHDFTPLPVAADVSATPYAAIDPVLYRSAGRLDPLP